MNDKEKTILKAIYGSDETKIIFGTINIPCYVLEDGTRVLSGKGMQESLGFPKNSSGTVLSKFLSRDKIAELIPEDVKEKIANKIEFTRKGAGGAASKTYGYDATLLIDLCDVLIQAKKAGFLTQSQELLSEQSEIIIRSVAKVGIISLIDEATGYQNVRAKGALQKILDIYLLKEFATWAKRFPDEFYIEMFRLKGWNFNDPKALKRPACVGRYTTDIVYSRLEPGIVEEIRVRNPKDDCGRTKARDHQLLTPDLGIPALSQHLHTAIAFMKASTSWDGFYRLLQRALPKKNEQMLLDFEDDK